MTKRILAFVLCISLIAVFAGVFASCSKSSSKQTIAIVTDAGELYDSGFNQGTLEAVIAFAEENGLNYKYYQPESAGDVKDTDRVKALRKAAQDGASIIVAPGALQENALRIVAREYPNIKFIYIDGTIIKDEYGAILQNVASVSFREQEAGFLAGYAVVRSGITQLGGVFGGSGQNRACNRFAYGFVQGAIAAAGQNGVNIKLSYKYGETFSSSDELKEQTTKWYKEDAIRVIFACGGDMIGSVKEAAESSQRGRIIGVDTDQSGLSSRVLTSAIKNVKKVVQLVLADVNSDFWYSKYAGKEIDYGVREDAVSLPTNPENWRFGESFTIEQYNDLYNNIKIGSFIPEADVAADCNDSAWWATKVEKLNEQYGANVVVELER